jgi:hypothetical protein
MSPPNESIDLSRHRDLAGRRSGPWARRVLVSVLVAVVVFALAGELGQPPRDVQAAGPAALLSVQAPDRLRGGLLYQARFTVTARQAIKEPQLILGPGWFDGLTINTIQPEPSQESNRNGHVALIFDKLPAGDKLRVWIQFQVNPTSVGRRIQLTELDDGDQPLVVARLPLTILP